MAIKLADTTRPNNYTDSSSIGTFPVAYAENVWLNNGADLETILGNLEVEPFRVTEMPLASVSELGNYYLYTGEDGTYKSGHLYECYYATSSTSQYKWRDALLSYRYNHNVYTSASEPILSDYVAGDIVLYTGKTTNDFEYGCFYRVLPTSSVQSQYSVTFKVTAGTGIVYYCDTPFEYRVGFIVYPSSSSGKNEPYQITSIVTDEVIISPYGWGGSDITYIGADYITTPLGWEKIGGGNSSSFIGTQAEWDALTTEEKIKYNIVYITDDEGTSQDIVDTVTDGDMHAVTSNAVFNAITNRLKGEVAEYGVVNQDGKTYFVPEIYENSLDGNPPCILLAYVIGENNGMALVGVNNRDASGFSYVDGQFNNFEYITIDGDLYPALKMSNDESVTIYVMYLGKAL